VFNSNAPSNCTTTTSLLEKDRHELEKRRANERILEVEQGLLTPLVFLASEAGSPQPILPISSSWYSTTGAGRLVNRSHSSTGHSLTVRQCVTSRINGRRMGGVWFIHETRNRGRRVDTEQACYVYTDAVRYGAAYIHACALLIVPSFGLLLTTCCAALL